MLPKAPCRLISVGFDQSEFDIRCEWGRCGLREISPQSDVVTIVDVLSFSTAVDVATSRGGTIFPYPLEDHSARAYADSVHATLASPRRNAGFSLSSASLRALPPGCCLVLPSTNGGALCFQARCCQLLTACLRNASAAARAAAIGSKFALIPAGETWDTGEIRPCLEDLIGAGAVIARLPGRRSPEADGAVAVFEHFRGNPGRVLRACRSGKELIARGFAEDVELAALHDVSRSAPRLVDAAFRGGDSVVGGGVGIEPI
jgi:2-phosphosulfolactate phosphatase